MSVGRQPRGHAAANQAKQECPKSHPYSVENTYFYVRPSGYPVRLCRTCRRERNRIRAAAARRAAVADDTEGMA